jgi:glycosyltransferase involved in cell wall biosynthesis
VRVGLDARKLRDGGIGTYIRQLLWSFSTHAGEHEWTALLDPRDLGTVAWPGTRVREIAVRAGKYGLGEHVVVPRVARAAGVDLLHEPHYTLPLGWTGPAVVTIHDLLHLRYPRFFAPGVPLYARIVAGSAVRRARLVIADSAFAKAEIVEWLGVDPARVRVVPLGVTPGLARCPAEEIAAFRRERALPSGYILYVGARKPHKNLPLLLKALARLAPAERPPLALSGVPWPPRGPLARCAARLGLADTVHFAGDLRDVRELACLYSGAVLYAQPALSEGFGLPPLEAMACGTPVLSSTGGALPETVGDAAILLAPRDPAAWAEAIRALLADTARREALVRAGLARARTFDIARTAAATLAVYEEALHGRRS